MNFMNKLTLNRETGFLESGNSLVAFGAYKKAKFLKLANKIIDAGKFPSFRTVCKAVGISLRTLERHLKEDNRFYEEYREVLLKGQDILVEKMFEQAQKPGGAMHMFGWLRRHFPEHWHPDSQITVQTQIDFAMLKKQIGGTNQYIDAELISEKDRHTLPPGSEV